MTKKLNMQTKTEKDILLETIEKYRPTDADLLEAFGVSRQQLWYYKRGEQRPGLDRLVKLAGRPDWYGDMAREMLSLRGLTVAAPVAVTVEEA